MRYISSYPKCTLDLSAGIIVGILKSNLKKYPLSLKMIFSEHIFGFLMKFWFLVWVQSSNAMEVPGLPISDPSWWASASRRVAMGYRISIKRARHVFSFRYLFIECTCSRLDCWLSTDPKVNNRHVVIVVPRLL